MIIKQINDSNEDKQLLLSDDVQKFLKDLRPDEVVLIREGISLVQSIKTTSKVMKWLFLTVIGAIIGGMALYKQFLDFLSIFRTH